jgi:ribosome maturation factor RimP
MQNDHWERILQPVFNETPYELAGVEFHGEAKRPCLRIFIDKPDGITISDISKMSREISIYLDVEANLQDAYTLEVSSPGLDRTLFNPNHYKSQVGKELNVKLKVPVEGRKNYRGILSSVGENTFELLCDEATQCFAYHTVDKAKVIPKYQFNEKSKRQNDE